ncbi:MAG: futalosine hydrolase [Candidatus Tumulicola sp.]
MILLTCAVDRELAPWTQRHGVETVVTGVGPVEAACAVAHALAQQRYKLVVNAGIAGALDGAARIGDGVAVVDDAFELALEDGRPIVLPAGQTVVDKAHSDPLLVAQLRRKGFPALHGITVARVTSSEATAARLMSLGAQIESMEGFSVLRACERAGVPAVELRGISNRVGSRERSGWDFDAGLSGLARVGLALFEIVDAMGGPKA